MNRNRIALAILLPVLALAIVWGQGADKQALQQKLAAIKQSIAQNQASLKAYTWTETVEVSMKGEVKKRNQNECRYGPEGKVQKTPIGAPDEGGSKGGLKGKIVAKKVDELKDYMDRVGSLVSRYVPPSPQNMQAAFQAGKAGLDRDTGELTFHDYVKTGDKFALQFDTATKKLRALLVTTYLDTQDDAVTFSANFSSLADGTNYLQESVINGTAKQVQIKTTNFGHHK